MGLYDVTVVFTQSDAEKLAQQNLFTKNIENN